MQAHPPAGHSRVHSLEAGSRAVTHVRSGGEGNLEPLQGFEGLCLSRDLCFAVPQAWL